MNSSSVYRRRSKIIIHPWSKTNMGILIASEPFFILPVDSDDKELGEALLSALGESQSGLPHPSDWPAANRSFLSSVGSRSWAEFVKGAVNCLVILRDA